MNIFKKIFGDSDSGKEKFESVSQEKRTEPLLSKEFQDETHEETKTLLASQQEVKNIDANMIPSNVRTWLEAQGLHITDQSKISITLVNPPVLLQKPVQPSVQKSAGIQKSELEALSIIPEDTINPAVSHYGEVARYLNGIHRQLLSLGDNSLSKIMKPCMAVWSELQKKDAQIPHLMHEDFYCKLWELRNDITWRLIAAVESNKSTKDQFAQILEQIKELNSFLCRAMHNLYERTEQLPQFFSEQDLSGIQYLQGADENDLHRGRVVFSRPELVTKNGQRRVPPKFLVYPSGQDIIGQYFIRMKRPS